MGLDDLFWRSIIWSVRKPFAANMIPPFVTMSFDDCSGRLDFRFVEIAADHKYVPMTSMFLKEVPARLFPKIRALHESGKAQFGTHAMDYWNHMVADLGRGEHPQEKLKENFAFEDDFYGKIGIKPGRTNRLHIRERGINALAFLKERGRTLCSPMWQWGVRKADMIETDGFHPYGLTTCFYDFLPDDHDFFGFASLREFGVVDYLTGCTPDVGDSAAVDIEKAASNAAGKIMISDFRDEGDDVIREFRDIQPFSGETEMV